MTCPSSIHHPTTCTCIASRVHPPQHDDSFNCRHLDGLHSGECCSLVEIKIELIPISSPKILLPGTSAIFPFGPAFIFQTSSRPPAQNNTAGSFTSNISFDAISNVSNVVVAVSQTMGRSLDTADLSDDGSVRQHINSSVFLFKDGNWTSYKLRKRRSTFDLAKQITNQVFAAVNCKFTSILFILSCQPIPFLQPS